MPYLSVCVEESLLLCGMNVSLKRMNGLHICVYIVHACI